MTQFEQKDISLWKLQKNTTCQHSTLCRSPQGQYFTELSL